MRSVFPGDPPPDPGGRTRETDPKWTKRARGANSSPRSRGPEGAGLGKHRSASSREQPPLPSEPLHAEARAGLQDGAAADLALPARPRQRRLPNTS